MLCVAIDPGSNGGIVEIDTDKGTVTATKMPETTADICSILKRYKYRQSFVLLEEQHARPAGILRRINAAGEEELAPMRGSVATWTFAQHYGEIRGILIALEIPFEEMKPRMWMKALGLRTKNRGETQTQWKNYLKAKAQEMYPGTRVTLAVADALLLCELCHRFHGRNKQIDPFADI